MIVKWLDDGMSIPCEQMMEIILWSVSDVAVF